MSGVRLSFMLSEMAELAKKHEPARKAFLEILEGLQAKIDGAQVPSFEDWQEWTAWCQNFEENPRVIAWYERHRDEDGRLFEGRTTERPQHFILTEVFELLIEKERPFDAARLIEDGREYARAFVDSYEMVIESYSHVPASVMSDEDKERSAAFNRDELRDNLSNIYGALLLAGRTDEAVGVADLLLKTLDDAESRVALVRAGIDIVQRQEASFSLWLDEAETAGASVRLVRRRLEKLPVVEEKAPAPEGER